MKITVMLFTILKKYTSGRLGEDGGVDIPEGSILEDLAEHLGIPGNVVKIYLLNEKPAQAAAVLHDGDRVKMFSFVGGG